LINLKIFSYTKIPYKIKKLKSFWPSTKPHRSKALKQPNKTMSYSMKSTTAKKALCQVCKDAGKSEKEYTSHFVRDKPGPDGVTVCPLLLSLNCRKCGKKGHTFKYCKVNTEKKKESRPAEKPKPVVLAQGKFDSLVESSDDEEEGEEKEPIQKPMAVTKAVTYADKLKARQTPLAPTLPDMVALRSAPMLPDMVALPQAPSLAQAPLPQAPSLAQAPLPQAPGIVQAPLPQAPGIAQAPLPKAPGIAQAPLPRAPVLPITDEERVKIQKLKEDCKKIVSQKCNWADSDSESDSEDD